jgi:hypothetical protein
LIFFASLSKVLSFNNQLIFQICMTILKHEKTSSTSQARTRHVDHSATKETDATVSGIPVDIIARCAKNALSSVRAACAAAAAESSTDATQLEAAAAGLIEAETLPQAGRWHRRDLSPALAAAWSAVARALRGHGAAARGSNDRSAESLRGHGAAARGTERKP